MTTDTLLLTYLSSTELLLFCIVSQLFKCRKLLLSSDHMVPILDNSTN